MKAPFKVKIIHGRGWYERWKGHTLRVVNRGGSFVLYADFRLGYNALWRHVEKEDVIIVEER